MLTKIRADAIISVNKATSEEEKMIKGLLEKRVLQPIGNFGSDEWESVRKEYIDILCREEYGMPLPAPTKLEFEVVNANKRFAAATATYSTIIAHTEISVPSLPEAATSLLSDNIIGLNSQLRL